MVGFGVVEGFGCEVWDGVFDVEGDGIVVFGGVEVGFVGLGFVSGR